MRAFDLMTSGKEYFINDDELREIRYVTRDRVDAFNALSARNVMEKNRLITDIFAQVGENVHIEKGLRVDYGV
ncbi:maltose acetyltransferase domain-containing protein [Hafnia paralvei]|uniref:maltose acetyltransferase domain-containing protein n=1 Tax=Hafnia paralvei TaxID=546367 RepID=UPI003CF57FD2